MELKRMVVNRRGVTRRVFLFGRWAIKVPAPWRWQTFLWGLLANMQERAFAAAGWPELAPVLWADRWGFVLVMPRLTPLTDAEFETFDYAGFVNRSDGSVVPVEEKSDSFGRLNRRIVAIDYGS
jgi:hypothetical protein